MATSSKSSQPRFAKRLRSAFIFTIAATCVIGTTAGSAVAQKKSAGTNKTYQLKNEPLRIFVSVSGVFEAAESAELKAETKSWKSLKIKKVLPEGTAVRAGEPVVWFKKEEYDRKLKNEKADLELAQLSLAAAELELDQAKKTLAMDQEIAERTFAQAKEDYNYFVKTDRPRREASAKFSIKQSEGRLENTQEELTQLEKMYKEDELTEESEEIVLKRAKRSVESAMFFLAGEKMRAAKTLETSLPREFTSLKDSLRRKELAFEKSRITLPASIRRKEIEYQKSTRGAEKSAREFGELEADGNQFVLTAPMAGVVYYGKATRGKWASASGSAKRELKVDSTVSSDDVVVTIVNTQKLNLRIDLTETQLRDVRAKSEGVVLPTAMPDKKLRAKILSVSLVPMSPGKFDCVASIENSDDIMPGMTGTMKLVAYNKVDALTVPESAVSSEDGVNSNVKVFEQGRFLSRTVEVGRKKGSKIEIVKGLKAGETILRSQK